LSRLEAGATVTCAAIIQALVLPGSDSLRNTLTRGCTLRYAMLRELYRPVPLQNNSDTLTYGCLSIKALSLLMPTASKSSSLSQGTPLNQKVAAPIKKSANKRPLVSPKNGALEMSQPVQPDAPAAAQKIAAPGEQPLFGADIGRRLRNLRHIKGLTLKDLADRTLCSESMLSKVGFFIDSAVNFHSLQQNAVLQID